MPGIYKTKDNHVLTISGEIHYYTPATQVPTEMEKLITWYNESKLKLHPVELAAVFHHKFVAIHPFSDGNGRVSRLCMNFILMKNGFPPAIIRNEKRKEYYVALEEADKGNPGTFIDLISDEVKYNLELILREAKRDIQIFDILPLIQSWEYVNKQKILIGGFMVYSFF